MLILLYYNSQLLVNGLKLIREVNLIHILQEYTLQLIQYFSYFLHINN
jgi:hypothetical protein